MLRFVLFFLTLIYTSVIFAQHQTIVKQFNRDEQAGAMRAFDERLAPFYHGVASGDPTADGFIIWTRVTPTSTGAVSVDWEISADTAFTSIVQNGTFTTDSSRDYTVKVVLTGLSEGQTYYYRFEAMGEKSITGRTRTADQDGSHLKFGVVSCNSYQQGYFGAFGRLAERNDLDAVIHLGDFIYEYDQDSSDWIDEAERYVEPVNELLAVNDYRMRYGWYRLDADLRRAMQQHPFIFIWDDHETANNSWMGGAENHNPLEGEGDWENRKIRAQQAYFEWVPIRDDPDYSIRRKLSYGPMAEFIMIDTRIEGREEQIYDVTDPAIWDTNRTILGDTQFEWFTDALKTSPAQWKLIGNQVAFAPLLLEDFEAVYPGAQNSFLDVWMGYPAEREKILDTLITHGIDDVVFLTGDVHISVAIDVPKWNGDSLFYNAADASGSAAVEFVVTSISSNNFDERLGSVFLSNLIEDLFTTSNPHGKYAEFDKHGYMVLDVTPARLQSDYYNIADKLSPGGSESWDEGWYTASGNNYLQQSASEAPPKAVQEVPAPDPTNVATGITSAETLQVWNVWPNPFEDRVVVGYSLLRGGEVELRIVDVAGKVVAETELTQGAGNYQVELKGLGELTPGTYLVTLKVEGVEISRKILK